MRRMLERVGLDTAITSSGDNESVLEEIRQRWLADDVDGNNYFCPNAKVIDALLRTSGAVG